MKGSEAITRACSGYGETSDFPFSLARELPAEPGPGREREILQAPPQDKNPRWLVVLIPFFAKQTARGVIK